MLCPVEKEIPVFDTGVICEAQPFRQRLDPDGGFMRFPLAFDVHKVGGDTVFRKTFDRRQRESRQQRKDDRQQKRFCHKKLNSPFRQDFSTKQPQG